MHLAIYTSSGTIDRVINGPDDWVHTQVGEGEHGVEVPEGTEPTDTIDVETREVVKGVPFNIADLPTKPSLPPYVELRAKLYPPVGEQLDMLFDAIKQGQFGEAAQDSQWFKRIKTVKEVVPKDQPIDPSVLYFMEALPQARPVDAGQQAPLAKDNVTVAKYLNAVTYSRKKKEQQ